MKRVFAILLFSIHFFNLVGYTLLFHYLQQKNTDQTIKRIETGNFSDKDLVLVKIPVLLPYTTNWSEYERYDGEVEWGGVQYHYVKRKILNDTLYLLCLPDIKGTDLVNARERYSKKINDYPDSPQKSKSSASKIVLLKGEYIQSGTPFALAAFEADAANKYSDLSISLLRTAYDCIIQPPDAPSL